MTVVNRRTFVPKHGHMDEVIAMLKDEATENVKRVYRAYYGPFDTVVLELEFASISEMEESWANWEQSESAASFMSRWYTITENGGSNEVWLLE